MFKKLFIITAITFTLLLCASMYVHAEGAKDVTFTIQQYEVCYTMYQGVTIYYLEHADDKQAASIQLSKDYNFKVSYNNGQVDFDMVFSDDYYSYKPVSFSSLRNGTVTISDADKDGSYDTVAVLTPDIFVIDDIDLETGIITAKNEPPFRRITLDRDRITLLDLGEWDVLEVYFNVYTNNEEEKMYKFDVITDIREGMITEIDYFSENSTDEHAYRIGEGDKMHDLADGAYYYPTYPNPMTLEAKGTFAIDSYGKIAMARIEEPEELKYGFVIGVDVGAFSERYIAYMLTQDGDYISYRFAETVNLLNGFLRNDVEINYVSGTDRDFFENILKDKLIMYELNDANEICCMNVAREDNHADVLIQITPLEEEYTYDAAYNRFTAEGKLPKYVNPDALIFYVSTPGGGFEKDISSVSDYKTLQNGESYPNAFYYKNDISSIYIDTIVIFDKYDAVINKNKFWVDEQTPHDTFSKLDWRDIEVYSNSFYTDKKLALAAYKNNKMVGYNDIPKYDGTLTLPLMTDNYYNLDYIKIFMWDSIDSLTPFEVKTIYNEEYLSGYVPVNDEYGYIIGVEDFGVCGVIGLLAENGKEKDYYLSENIEVVSPDLTTNTYSGRDWTDIRALSNMLTGKMVKYYTNADNEICKIQLANTENSDAPFYQYNADEKSYTFNKNTNQFISNNGGNPCSVNANTMVFYVERKRPYPGRYDYFLSTSEVFDINKLVNGAAYNEILIFDDDNGNAKAVVIFGPDDEITITDMAVVDHVNIVINSKGYKVAKIYFRQNGGEMQSLLTTMYIRSSAEQLYKGNGIQFTCNAKGEINSITVLYTIYSAGERGRAPGVWFGGIPIEGTIEDGRVKQYIFNEGTNNEIKLTYGPVRRWYREEEDSGNYILPIGPTSVANGDIDTWDATRRDFLVGENVNFYIYDNKYREAYKLFMGDVTDVAREYLSWVQNGADYKTGYYNGFDPAPALNVRDYLIVREYNGTVTDVVVIKAYDYEFL